MKKADFIVIAVVAVVAAVLLVFLYGVNDNGNIVQIQVDGTVVEELPIDVDTRREITTDEGTNVLVIENGSAYMEQADCPDGICVNHKSISKSGESIICLPHKVVISIVSSDSNDSEIDAVA